MYLVSFLVDTDEILEFEKFMNLNYAICVVETKELANLLILNHFRKFIDSLKLSDKFTGLKESLLQLYTEKARDFIWSEIYYKDELIEISYTILPVKKITREEFEDAI